MSAKSEPGTTRTAFITSVINAGISTLLGTTAGFFVGGLADIVHSLVTGQAQVHYALILAQACTYVGIFVGIVAALGAGATSAPTVKSAVESRSETADLPPDSAGPSTAGGVEQAGHDEEHSQAA